MHHHTPRPRGLKHVRPLRRPDVHKVPTGRGAWQSVAGSVTVTYHAARAGTLRSAWGAGARRAAGRCGELMAVEREDVEHAAKLSRLKLRPEEVEVFTRQLGRIIEYVGKLAELDVSGEEPMMHASFRDGGSAPFREDVPGERLERKKALGGAPSAADGFFRVPPVIDTTH